MFGLIAVLTALAAGASVTSLVFAVRAARLCDALVASLEEELKRKEGNKCSD